MTGAPAVRQTLLKLPARVRNGKYWKPEKQPNFVTFPCTNPASSNTLRHRLCDNMSHMCRTLDCHPSQSFCPTSEMCSARQKSPGPRRRAGAFFVLPSAFQRPGKKTLMCDSQGCDTCATCCHRARVAGHSPETDWRVDA